MDEDDIRHDTSHFALGLRCFFILVHNLLQEKQKFSFFFLNISAWKCVLFKLYIYLTKSHCSKMAWALYSL